MMGQVQYLRNLDDSLPVLCHWLLKAVHISATPLSSQDDLTGLRTNASRKDLGCS